MEDKKDLFDLENECDEKGRSRSWVLLLYPDNPDHVKVYEKISSLDCEYAGVKHDKDVLADGTPAKDHWHILLRYKNPVWNTAVSESLDLDLRWIRKVDNWNRMARYLVHKDQPKKYQYDKDALFGTMVETAVSAINKSDPEAEAQKVEQIVELINSWDGFIELSRLTSEICKKKLYAEFRRGGQIFLRMIDRHNWTYQRAEQKRDFDAITGRSQIGDFAESVKKHQNQDWLERCEQLDSTSYLYPEL